MKKAEFIAKVAEKAKITKKEATKVVNAVLETITEALSKGDTVQFVGFGTFSVRKRAAREGRNPRTQQPIKIPATKVPVFRPGKELREAVKK
ncbi:MULTISPECIES: HU family DNA-binding protein [Dictyoglomus]|jgi:DNA-binding protein HU-beta|uniref:Histone family protein DNA-binding protein n=3 Tax=Dictyoglomus TaxID=13 RepID=B8E2E4_DICTD|nr:MULTISPECIES: HU family DNA-binding protein [Dictyoglomus]ACI18563.1 non-specific DNA-binding protein [Dictyoglomus thermophilum H-6-12]ACK42788.1 histone family protein DNA-binding protein [Dictyoglomus turgidum DSM 6724]MCX7719860.1 HU family DNA-binding protein [Dictyoglomus thermophilum]PNV79740.1 MAG: HU family DNA-binding protein [Dictyoglomus turgidum]TYT22689.1 HU family DNA-binding protein [Dictyoglomus thermophilum]